VSYPASSPNVVSVGGTTLNFYPNGTFANETVWNDGGYATGGGVSAFEPEPSYQVSYGVKGSNGHRAVPDVSYCADQNPGYSFYLSGSKWITTGGTSFGTPQWAAIKSLGLLASNDRFYAIASSPSNYSSCFRDITVGSNGHYNAEVGYDCCTGLGSPITTTFHYPPGTPIGAVGITGYKLIFKETMNNSLDVPMTINYYWSFGVDRWSGTQWVASGISGSSNTVTGYSIPALTILDLPYYVYHLNLSTVNWGDWLRISYTFHWTYDGINYSTNYVAKLNVHPGDISGTASITLPYPGADGIVNLNDLQLIINNWLKSVPTGADPTSAVARADINGDGIINVEDVNFVVLNWLKTWTNTPPPG
jgi:subtilase family serine protease